MTPKPRVVLLAFDGFPLRSFRETITPNLWKLGVNGGYAQDGGQSGLPATTYPGFASLLSGASPSRTGVRTTARRPGAVPGWAGSDTIRVPTILHAAREAGLVTAAVMGDHKLQRVLRLDEMDRVWPPEGRVPEGTELDAHGYPTNAAIRDRILDAAFDPEVDLLFVHLNETDTIGHDLGPNDPRTVACARAADRIAGELLEVLAPEWHRTMIAVVSDHDMTTRLPLAPIDPTAGPDCAGLADDWIADGCAAWVRLAPGADFHMAIKHFAAVEGVAAWRWRDPNILLLLAETGRVFAAPHIHLGGVHGSISTTRTLAIVGGGHPDVPVVARAISVRPPQLKDWAPTIAAVLDLDLPDAEGRNLAAVEALESAG
jgi:hypothetical protein